MMYRNIMIVLVMVFFTACTSTTAKPNSEASTQHLKVGAISYAYMEDGKTLVSISREYKEPKVIKVKSV